MSMERKSWFWKFAAIISVVISVDLVGSLYSRSLTNGENTYRVTAISVSGDKYGEKRDSSKYKQKVTVEYEENTLELDWESEDCMHLYKEGDTILIKKDKDGDRMKIVSFGQSYTFLFWFGYFALCIILIKSMTI